MTPRVVVITFAQCRVVSELCRDGSDNATIARRLNLSPDTVKSHMRAVLKAADMPSRTALVVAIARGEVRLRVARWPRAERRAA